MGSWKPNYTNLWIPVTGCMIVLLSMSCANADHPSLSPITSETEMPTSTPEAEKSQPQEALVPTEEQANNPEQESTTEPADPAVSSTRGITENKVRIGVIKTSDVFSDVEIGVEARIRRVIPEDASEVREIEIVKVIDDEGDPTKTLEAAKTMVEQNVFAIVLASLSADQAVTDYLAEQNMPFFGWGFLDGFCYPNKWGFGFNGCLNGHALGVPGAALDDSSLRTTKIFYGRQPTLTLVTSSDDAGKAMESLVQQVWGDNLLSVVKVSPDQESGVAEYILDEIRNHDPDILWLSIGLSQTLQYKAQLISSFSGMVVDDVTYLPGILREYETSKNLEGGYVFSQFPPQEEYRQATTRIATDLENIAGPLIYSQAISLGYWSADFLIEILEEAGEELDTRTFFNVANIRGIIYDSGISGGPCALMTALVHQDPAGGVSLLQVRGGVFRPVVDFNCPQRYWED